MRLVQTEASFVVSVVTKIKLIVTPFFRKILLFDICSNKPYTTSFYILKTHTHGLIKFLVPINIHSFVFSPYKIKSHLLVPIKIFVSIFSPINFFLSTFSPCQKFPSTVLVPKMLKENVTGTKKCDFIL